MMKKLNSSALSLTLFLVVQAAFAQNNYNPNPSLPVVQPSYESYRVDKLVTESDVPYSGELNFSLPILSVPGRHDHNFNLNLTYNSNISQRQKASWVGLGWDLEVGAVERSIIGRSDDQKDELWAGDTLQNAPSCFGGTCKPERVGRLNSNHTLTTLLRDQADMYKLMIDGGGMEILPFPSTIGKYDTLSPSSFMPLQWRPWDIEANWQQDVSQIRDFAVTKEDGTIYQFADTNHIRLFDNGGPVQQSFRYPFRWNLTSIKFTDGSETSIRYKYHNNGNEIRRFYDNVMIDRQYYFSANVFGKRTNLYEWGQIYHRRSSPDTIYTNTHYVVFKTSRPSVDSTEAEMRLDSLILYERYTNLELKRVIFGYAVTANSTTQFNDATGTPLPAWQTDTKLNNSQLTLTSVTIRSGSVSIPPYEFTYTTNPKIAIDTLYLRYASPTYADSNHCYKNAALGTAWRLKDVLLPTKGKISYQYERISDVRYDPEGTYAPHSQPFNYNMEPQARLKAKTVSDSLGGFQTWNYAYGDAVFDAPSRPIVSTFTPRKYRNELWLSEPASYYRHYSGCPIGHRWVRVDQPDGSSLKRYFTSSYFGTGADSRESQPDSIRPYNSFFNADSLFEWSRFGRRGIVWKEETAADSTIFKYSFIPQGKFRDIHKYIYAMGYEGEREYVEQSSIWPRLDTIKNYRDGVVKTLVNLYNQTRRESATGNGLLSKTTEFGNFFDRVTEYSYAYAKYPPMDTLGLRSQLYSITVKRGPSDDERKTWTTWWKVNDRWLPKSEWIWNSFPTATSAPTDTTTGSVKILSFDYDAQGYSNIVQETESNNFVYRRYYSSDTLFPFQTDTVGLRRGYLTGYERPQRKPLLRSSYKYDRFGNIREISDENGKVKKYLYDELGRLTSVIGPSTATLAKYSFAFMTSATSPNRYRTTTFRAYNDSISAYKYLDGLGYLRQDQISFADSDIVSVTNYDGMRRVDSVFKPYQVHRGGQKHTYDPSYLANATSYVYNSPAGAYPYSRNEYYGDGSGRLKHMHAPGDTFQSEAKNRYLAFTYGSPTGQSVVHPISTTSNDPGWSFSGGGSLHGALNDGLTPDDNDYVKIQGPNNNYLNEDFVVRLDSVPGPINPTGSYIVTFRAQVVDNPQDLTFVIQLLEGTTVKGSRVLNDPETTFQNETFSVSASSITDPKNLFLKFIVAGYFEFAGDQIRISWAKVDMFFPDLYRTTTTDENGIKSLSYTDKLGNPNTSVVDSAGLKITTRYEYDALGQRIKITDPRGLVSTMTYNTRQLQTEGTTPDGGTVKYRYDLAGNLRFMQDAVQSGTGKYTYQKYDSSGRVIEIGEYSGGTSFAAADSTTRGNPAADFPTAFYTAKVVSVYDTNKTGISALMFARNLHGKLFNIQTYTNGIRDDIYYSYDDFGRTEWQIFKHGDLSGYRQLAYEYNLRGDITKASYIDQSKTYLNTYFFYEYDVAGRLKKVYSGSKEDGSNKITDATYTTYANGRLQRIQLGSAQGVDYRYNERDWVKQINHPDLTSGADPGGDGPNGIVADKFGMLLGYHNIAEVGSFDAVPARYNGDVAWMKYNMSGVNFTGSAGTTSKVGRSFKYDNAGRLTKANFGYYTTVWQQSAAFDEPTFTYDPTGNIQTMSRYGDNGGLMDSLTYNYISNTNRLKDISDFVTSGSFSNDIDNQSANNYVYDAAGNITSDAQGGITSVTYDYRNNPVQLTKSGVTTTYRYDPTGNRSFKSGTTAGKYHYINDQSGRTVAVLDSLGYPKMFNLHGSDHFGYIIVNASVTYTPPPPSCGEEEFSIINNPEGVATNIAEESSSSAQGPDPCLGRYDTSRTDLRFYYLKDQVGTIKMTIKSDGSIASYDDYYPNGMVMSGRSMTSAGDGRYKYSSRERDPEVGTDYFGARSYDSKVSRWKNVDPGAGQYPSNSPYSFVANNPIKRVEANGAFWLDIHRQLTLVAMAGLFSPFEQTRIQLGVMKSDALHMNESRYHFDNENFAGGSAIMSQGLTSGSLVDLGMGLHALQDFYSHSNFVELASAYFGESNIPTFDEAMQNDEFKAIWEQKGTTGYWNEGAPEGKMSHEELNKDGGPLSSPAMDKLTRLAMGVAARHSRLYLLNALSKDKYESDKVLAPGEWLNVVLHDLWWPFDPAR